MDNEHNAPVDNNVLISYLAPNHGADEIQILLLIDRLDTTIQYSVLTAEDKHIVMLEAKDLLNPLIGIISNLFTDSLSGKHHGH